MSTFNADYEGIGEMLCAPFMVAEMRRRAVKVEVRAEATAPEYAEGPHPGRYKAAFRVESGVRHGRTARAYGRVVNDAPEARWVEYGSKNNPRRRILGRALDAAKE